MRDSSLKSAMPSARFIAIVSVAVAIAAHSARADAQLDQVTATYRTRDTLLVNAEPSEDARACLQGLTWQPSDFEVTCERQDETAFNAYVRFASAVSTGDALNDNVWLEWYAARSPDGSLIAAPAVVVIHESGRGMTVGKLFAKGLQQSGLHAFLIHLPYYGKRRDPQKPQPSAEQLVPVMRQANADVRRARDAVAALPLVQPQFIALQGTSLGGFVASTAAALDGKFDSVFLMLSGGDLYELVERGAKDTAKLRIQLEQAGLTGEKLKSLLATVEPNRLAHRLDPAKTWLYSGIHDDVVPLANAESLAKAARLEGKHHIKMNANHYSGVVLLPFVIRHMANEIKRGAGIGSAEKLDAANSD